MYNIKFYIYDSSIVYDYDEICELEFDLMFSIYCTPHNNKQNENKVLKILDDYSKYSQKMSISIQFKLWTQDDSNMYEIYTNVCNIINNTTPGFMKILQNTYQLYCDNVFLKMHYIPQHVKEITITRVFNNNINDIINLSEHYNLYLITICKTKHVPKFKLPYDCIVIYKN